MLGKQPGFFALGRFLLYSTTDVQLIKKNHLKGKFEDSVYSNNLGLVNTGTTGKILGIQKIGLQFYHFKTIEQIFVVKCCIFHLYL